MSSVVTLDAIKLMIHPCEFDEHLSHKFTSINI